MKSKIIYTIFLFLLVIGTANAYTYEGETSIISGTNKAISSTAKGLINLDYRPLNADLDGDGQNEIIVFDNGDIKLYRSKDLTIIDAFSYSSLRSNVILDDLDNDNLTDIIFKTASTIEFIEYNGTHFTNVTVKESSSNAVDGIGCGQSECFGYFATQSSFKDNIATGIYLYKFNYTTYTESGQIDAVTVSSGNAGGFCLPRDPHVQVGDFDADGNEEFVLSYMEQPAGSTSKTNHVLMYNYNAGFNSEHSFSNGYTSVEYTNGQTCLDTGARNSITAPLTQDFDGFTGNGKETAIANQISVDDFRIYMLSDSLGTLSTYPTFTDGEGTIISNLFLADAFNDGTDDNNDVCVLGQDTQALELELVCGSEVNSYLGSDTLDFTYDYSDGSIFNMTNTDYSYITHSIQTKSDLVSGFNPDEIVTTFGIFTLDYTFFDELELDYAMPVNDFTVLPTDHENNGLQDLVLASSSSLIYIDDGFSNTVPDLNNIQSNLCINQIVKENQTLSLTVSADDVDGDTIFYTMNVASLSANSSIFYPEGQNVILSVSLVNQSFTSETLTVTAYDGENIATFTTVMAGVSAGGLTFAECSNYDLVTPSTSDSVTGSLNSTQQESVQYYLQGAGAIDEEYNPLIALVIMVAITLVVGKFMSESGYSGNTMTVGLVLTFIGSWFMMVLFGMLPLWTIILGIAFTSAIFGFKFWTASRGE